MYEQKQRALTPFLYNTAKMRAIQAQLFHSFHSRPSGLTPGLKHDEIKRDCKLLVKPADSCLTEYRRTRLMLAVPQCSFQSAAALEEMSQD